MKKLCVIILFIAFYLQTGKSQDNKVNINTPEAASLINYIKQPVNYNRGLADISIPLYEILVDGVRIPITLSYHHAGMKQDSYSYWLGQGWSLNADASIVRGINGKPDINHTYLPAGRKYPGTTQEKDNTYFSRLLDGGNFDYDEQPDDYFYHLAGKGGSFVFKINKDRSKEILTIPFDPIRIRQTAAEAFEITDEKGIRYLFGGSYDYMEQQEIGYNRYVNSAWKCHSIYGVSQKHAVSFYYSDIFETKKNYSAYMTVEDVPPWGEYSAGFCEYPGYADNVMYPSHSLPTMSTYYAQYTNSCLLNKQSYWGEGGEVVDYFFNCSGMRGQFNGPDLPGSYYINTKRINKIWFGNGEVHFLEGEYYNPQTGTSTSYLAGIDVIFQGAIIRKITFENTFAKGYPVLKKLEITGHDNGLIDSYQFAYNGNPPFGIIDYWGNVIGNCYGEIREFTVGYAKEDIYYSDNNNEKTIYRNMESIGSDERERETPQEGILTSITNAMGCITKFTYESNYYIKQDTRRDYSGGEPVREVYYKVHKAGGLRIRSIEYTDPENHTKISRRFKYGRIKQNDEYRNYRIAEFEEDEEDGLGAIAMQITPETHMTTQIKIIEGKSTTRLRTFHSSLLNNCTYMGSPIVYDRVTEYIETEKNGVVENNGKTVYKYFFPYGFHFLRSWLFVDVYPETDRYFFDTQSNWYYGELVSKENYKNTSGTYQLVQKTDYDYESFNFYNDTIQVGKVAQRKIVSKENDPYYNPPQDKYPDLYQYYFYNIFSGVKKLIKETDYTYTNHGTVISQKEYTYDNLKHLYPASVKMTNSNGTTKTNYMKYPLDTISQETGQAHAEAVTQLKNIWNISPVLEEKTVTSTGTIIAYNCYKIYDNGLPLFHKQLTQMDNEQPVEHMVYHLYDSYGNPIYVTKADKVKTVYIWGYNGQYPIAVIDNATYEQVLGALGNIPPESLSSAAIPDMVKINGLRNHPLLSNASVMSYTYNIFGMESTIDSRGLTNTYHYDAANRLQYIKNHEGKVIQSFDYHYQNQ